MQEEMKQKWINALRSGNYKQTYGRLKHNDAFCCLGVLCDISQLSSWEKEEPLFGIGIRERYIVDHEQAYTKLPSIMKFSYGISDLDEIHLIKMNDSGRSFEEIAKYIENNM